MTTQFNWNAVGEHLDATQEQHDREIRMGEAQDKLADYEAMRDSMVMFLRALHRANPKSVDTDTILYMLVDMEVAVGYQKAVEMKIADIVYEAIIKGNTEGAQRAIDDHFGEYLRQARAIANGEGL